MEREKGGGGGGGRTSSRAIIPLFEEGEMKLVFNHSFADVVDQRPQKIK